MTTSKAPHEMTYRVWREQERARLRAEYPNADPEGIESCLATAFTTWIRHLERAAMTGITLRRQVLDSMAREYSRPLRRDAGTSEDVRMALRAGEGRVLALFSGTAESGRTGWIPPTLRKAGRR